MNALTLLYLGFVLGLTGAMTPGPLLTVTIAESVKRGGVVGLQIALGHSLLELFLIIVIVLGFTRWLADDFVYGIIAVLGGMMLVYMAISTLRSIPKYTLYKDFEDNERDAHPVIVGATVTLSNPYWFIWWLTMGVGYVTFAKDLGLKGITSFFLGHISADFAWYGFVGYGVEMGGKVLKASALKLVLLFCSLFLLFFGAVFFHRGIRLLL